MSHKKLIHYLRLAVAVFWGAILFGGILWIVSYLIRFGFSSGKSEIISSIIHVSEWKTGAFLLAFALRGLFLIPPLVLVVIAGAIFDPLDALVLSLAGQVVSGIILYLIAQFIGREFILQHENEFFKKIDHALSQKGFFATLILTLMPFIPADSVTIVAAITGISFADFLLGFFLGSIGIFIPFVLLGKSLSSVESFFWAIIPFVFLLIITVWAWEHPRFRDFLGKKEEKKN